MPACLPSMQPSGMPSASSTSAIWARPPLPARRGGLRQPLSDCRPSQDGPGQAQYTLLCNPDGGVVDDMIAYLRSADEVFLIPNAANCERVVSLLSQAAPDGVKVTNQHRDYAVLAVQGTLSDEVLGSRTSGRPRLHDLRQR